MFSHHGFGSSLALPAHPCSETADEIVGHLDSVTAGSASGWIANVSQPWRIESVTVLAPNGDRLSFMPFVPRPDVCAALGAAGRFGFSVPTAALRALGPVVRFADRRGGALAGGCVRLPPLADPLIDRQTWVFLHIPKTGGTSIRNALAAAVAPEEAAFIYPDGFIGLSPAELEAMPLWQRGALRLVIGHMVFGIDAALPNAAGYATFLRDPEARLRSNYFHHADPGGRFMAGGAEMPLDLAASRGLADEFDNLMVRVISGCGTDQAPIGAIGERHVEAALANIRRRFGFVGLMEQADEHYPALCAALGIPGRALLAENARAPSQPAGDGSAVDWEEAMRRNRFDAMLYQRVQAEGLAGRALAPAAGAGHLGAPGG